MRDCENCVYARPYGGENDNRCSAWDCYYINRQDAIHAYLALRNVELEEEEEEDDIQHE